MAPPWVGRQVWNDKQMMIKKLPDGSYGVVYLAEDGAWCAERLHKSDLAKARRERYLTTDRPTHRELMRAAIGGGYAYSLATCNTASEALDYIAREAGMIAAQLETP